MGTLYEQDVMAWASEQAALLRAGKLAAIDETGLDTFPEDCPWAMAQVLMQDFLPQG